MGVFTAQYNTLIFIDIFSTIHIKLETVSKPFDDSILAFFVKKFF